MENKFIPVEKWTKKIQSTNLSGFALQVLMRSVIADRGDDYRITINIAERGFLNKKRADEIVAALNLNKKISFGLRKEPLTDIPQDYIISEEYAKKQRAYEEIKNDPNVQMLQNELGATIIGVKVTE